MQDSSTEEVLPVQYPTEQTPLRQRSQDPLNPDPEIQSERSLSSRTGSEMGDSVRYEEVMRELTPMDRRRIRRFKLQMTLNYIQLLLIAVPLIALYKANSTHRDAQGFTPTQFENPCASTLFSWFLSLASLLLVQLIIQGTRLHSMQNSG